MAIYEPNSNQHSDGGDSESIDTSITFFVDIPKVNGDGSPSGEWFNVESFEDKQAAIDYVMKHFGADEEGRVSLISQS
jgi:hypothetical protein